MWKKGRISSLCRHIICTVCRREHEMDIKGPKQLYNKLLFIYTFILVCVISVMLLYFLHQYEERFLEQIY